MGLSFQAEGEKSQQAFFGFALTYPSCLLGRRGDHLLHAQQTQKAL